MDKAGILFVGDFGSAYPEKIELDNSISELISGSKYACVNFEGCLHQGKLISPSQNPVPQSDLSPQWLTQAGFNIINLANNHTMDYGETGLKKTTTAFNKDITLLGAGRWEEAYSLKTIRLENHTIGLLAGTSSDFSALMNPWEDKKKDGCACIFTHTFNELVLFAKKDCDYLIILPHAGLEYIDIPIPVIREKYREFIDLGADAIIASHPHCPQGIEIYKDKPIFYSLGNFYFDGSYLNRTDSPKYWCHSVAVKIDIKNGVFIWETYPITRNRHQLRLSQDVSYLKHLDEISSILRNDDKYIALLNDVTSKRAITIKSWFLNGLNAVEINHSFSCLKQLLKAFLRGQPNNKIVLHQLREESSHYVLKHYYEKQIKS